MLFSLLNKIIVVRRFFFYNCIVGVWFRKCFNGISKGLIFLDKGSVEV